MHNVIPLAQVDGQTIDNVAKPVLTHDRLVSVLHYEPLTGVFTWKARTSHRVRIGDVAGSKSADGRLTIRIDGRLYMASRLAVFYMTGSMSDGDVDHRDTDKLNDRYLNLRVVTQQVNNQNHVRPYKNNRLGLLGVSEARPGRYRATLRHQNKSIHLGTFDDANVAHQTYITEKRRIHEGCTL